jgi:hypothetical protein
MELPDHPKLPKLIEEILFTEA